MQNPGPSHAAPASQDGGPAATAGPEPSAPIDPVDLALVADLTKGLNDLAAQMQADRDLLRKGTARVVAMEKDLTRFQTLTQAPSAGAAKLAASRPAPDGPAPPGAAASSDAPILHVCGPGCSHYAFHEASPATHSVAQHLARRRIPEPVAHGPAAAPAGQDTEEIDDDAAEPARPAAAEPAHHVDLGHAVHAPPKGAYLALSWFDQLMDHVPPEGIHAFLDYYGQVGWIDPAARTWLGRLADGVTHRGVGAPLDSLVPDPVELARLHRANLKILERMRAQDLGPDAVRQLQRDLRRTLGDRPSKAR